LCIFIQSPVVFLRVPFGHLFFFLIATGLGSGVGRGGVLREGVFGSGSGVGRGGGEGVFGSGSGVGRGGGEGVLFLTDNLWVFIQSPVVFLRVPFGHLFVFLIETGLGSGVGRGGGEGVFGCEGIGTIGVILCTDVGVFCIKGEVGIFNELAFLSDKLCVFIQSPALFLREPFGQRRFIIIY